jgi:AcrR family transcriptional regulator
MRVEGKGFEQTMSKRDDILASALRIVSTEGIHALTMEKIQKESGVGSGTMYNYFESKDVLLRVLYENAMTRMTHYILKDYTATGNVRVDFEALIGRFLDYSIAYFDEFNFTDQYSFFICDGSARELSKTSNLFFQASDVILKSGQEQMIIKGIDRAVLERIVAGIIVAVSQSFYISDMTLTDGLKRDIITACWDAIKA